MCNKRPHFQHFNQIYQKRNNPIGSSLFMDFLKYILCLTQKNLIESNFIVFDPYLNLMQNNKAQLKQIFSL